jgi:hypothetical protein
MRYFTLAFVVLWASAALAVNQEYFPETVYETNCTDIFSVPLFSDGPGAGARPEVQISGAGDNWCDHDSRILARPLTADTLFGPFVMPSANKNIIVYVDADVVSNDVDTWQIRITENRPHDGVLRAIHNPGSQATEGDRTFIFGPIGGTGGSENNLAATASVAGAMPKVFYIQVDLLTATSWDGSISWRSF